MSEEKIENHRAADRFVDPDANQVKLSLLTPQGETRILNALLLNESPVGIALIVIGDVFEEGLEVNVCKETESVSAPCQVLRCKEIDNNVYSLALKRLDENE